MIGKSLPRVDAREKLLGETRYTSDLHPDRQLHARFVRSQQAHAVITRIDCTAARALPGVRGCFTAADLTWPGLDPTSRPRAPLAIERVLFAGMPVAVVVADDPGIAADAAALVEVEYEPLEVVVDGNAARQPGAPRVRQTEESDKSAELGMHGAAGGEQAAHQASSPNVVNTSKLERGDVERGFQEADLIVENTYRTPIVHQGYLEPRAVVAIPESGGAVTVHTSTQALFHTRSEIAETLGIPEHRVKVVAMPVGGGFGAKYVLLEPLVAWLALTLRRPVTLTFTGMDEFFISTPAPAAEFWIKTGAKQDGTITALQARVLFDSGAYPGAPLGLACMLLGASYRIENFHILGEEVVTHKSGQGAYRAPGAVQAAFAMESQVDELARGLGLDPLEVRRHNAAQEGDKQPFGRPWPTIGLKECLEKVAQHPLWRDRESRRSVNGSVRRGVGLAAGGWPGGTEPAAAVCRLNGDGTVSVVVGSVDISGTNTVLTQITASVLGLSMDDVGVVAGDSDVAPQSGASGGSKIIYTVGRAVLEAAEDARNQILKLAAQELEASVDDLETAGGEVRIKGIPGKTVTFAKLAQLSTRYGSRHQPVLGRGQAGNYASAPAFAVHVAEVEVDTETGAVHVVRYVAAQDVGRALNPAAVEGQIRGGVTQGVGWALTERIQYDEQGQLVTATLMDYALPKIEDAPEVDVVLVEVPSANGPFGARGVGEPPVVPAAAAIANAIRDAVGARIVELPATSERVLSAIPSAGR
ncbi:MAG: xanthine dehydrogenase family protein [Chloroflexi bacterium]|nr:xanthine dehydrogenase family protein [Chloroflexota bacterium]